LKYRLNTYKTIKGKIKSIELPDSSYGEWIIYSNKNPKYHITCFDPDSELDKLIKDAIENAGGMEPLLSKLNTTFNQNLSLDPTPFLKIKISTELSEVNLSKLPKEWLMKSS
jgi:hypothetical protein